MTKRRRPRPAPRDLVSEPPRRLQLSRARGFRLPPGAVSVARPTFWGNPYRAEQRPPLLPEGAPWGAAEAVAAYELMLASGWRLKRAPGYAIVERAMAELEGLDLACWCRLEEPCHAAVLLAFANDRVGTSEGEWVFEPGELAREAMLR